MAQLAKYVVVSTANWKDKSDPRFSTLHGIFDDLNAANNAAKAIHAKELGDGVSVEYDDNGCLFVGKEKETDETKKRKRATAKKDLFKVQVLMHQIQEPTTFTKKITLYKYEQRYERENRDFDGELDDEEIEDTQYFLTKRAALEYWYEAKGGDEEELEELLKGDCRLPEFELDDIDFCEKRYYTFETLNLMAVFPKNGKQVNKGYVEIKTGSQAKTKLFKVYDWDGSEKDYNKLFPEAPLRPEAVKTATPAKGTKRVKSAASVKKQD